ncbi:MAG TPA: FkbM family methyltransferase [Saprospiraceae bacterium]|nr:FkbM family methyltransferase [Saprospiraceae bacterium]
MRKIIGYIKYAFLDLLGISYLYDKRKKEIIKFLPKNAQIIDCGANDGTDSIKFAKLLPNCTVYAIEPVPDIFHKLVNKTKKFKNIKTFNVAISDQDSTAMMHVSSGKSDGSSSLLKPKEHLHLNPEVYFFDKIEVKTRKFDTWAVENNIPSIDCMWLDMQGYELFALKEAQNLLDNCTCIYTEFSEVENYEEQSNYKELKDYLIGKGFILFKEYKDYNFEGDALFIRKNKMKE